MDFEKFEEKILKEVSKLIDEAIRKAFKDYKVEDEIVYVKELSDEEKEVFDELAKRCFEVASGKKSEEAPVKTADLSTEKEEPKEIVGKEQKQAHKYAYSAYRIKGDK